MITLQEMSVLIAYMIHRWLIDLKNQLLLISFFLLSMYHIASHNIGLGSYNDDFNRLMKDLLMKDLLMKDHFVKGFNNGMAL